MWICSALPYDPADTNKDGTVSATEALAYALSNSSSTSSSSDASTDTTASNTDITNALASMMQNVLQPGQAEGHHGHHGGGKKDEGLTADQMTEIASKTDDSDLASLMKTLASNFEAADANGDGKVTHDEAMAYQEQNQATGATTTASTSSSSSASALDENVVKQIMQLVQTYSGQSSSKAQSSLGTVSIAA